VSGNPFTLFALLPRKECPVPIEEEAGWTPEPVWMFQRRDKYPAAASIQTPDCPACSTVTILTMLSQLPCFIRQM